MARPPKLDARKPRGAVQSLKLKPADPFELIRWLARSQSDPRKAVAELVQNSLDADAHHIVVERVRRRGVVELVVRDDGNGVLAQEERQKALAWLASNVGHSRKLGLSAAERQARVIAGRYGVGLLGFWAIGHVLELRTRVDGSELFALRLEEESSAADIVKLPLRLDAPDTFTEVVVRDVHSAALKPLGGRRLTDYLASELRGQLLRPGIELTIHDRLARGTAQKRFDVVPRRFIGERLDLPSEIALEGHPPIRLEIYHSPGAERPAVQIAAAGTLVADDIAELSSLGLATAPWVGRELTGLIDFADFQVPPGNRRGVLLDASAVAFARAVRGLDAAVEAELGRVEGERRAAADRDVVRDLRKALRGISRRLPQYDLPHIEGSGRERGAAEPGGAGVAESTPVDDTPIEERTDPAPELFPPGPLATLRIVPTAVQLAPRSERRVQAVAADAHGKRIADLDITWRLDDEAVATLADGGHRPVLRASPEARLGDSTELTAVATQGDIEVIAIARIVIDEPAEKAALGIPEPHLVSDTDGRWRSRMVAERWEVNETHEDYRAVRGTPRARVRYLLALLAKEIVLRTSNRPETADVLESLVEILAHAERNLRGA